jgi:hypothetical protein
VIDFLADVIDGLDKHLPLLPVGLELLLQLRSFQKFFLEIQLSEQICSVIGESRPSIFNSVPEPFDLFPGDRQVLDDSMLEPFLFEGDQLL